MFLGDEDREMFLRTFGETCGRTGWRLHAYVLMSNHYHLLLETLQANLAGRDEMVSRMNEALARLALGTSRRSRSHCRSL
jgi:REP element-mobilizing transposase RayT